MVIQWLLFTNNIYTLHGDIKSENDGFSLGDLVEIPEMNGVRGRVYGYLTSFSKIFQKLCQSVLLTEETGVPILGENPDLLHVTDKLSYDSVFISPWNIIGIDLFDITMIYD